MAETRRRLCMAVLLVLGLHGCEAGDAVGDELEEVGSSAWPRMGAEDESLWMPDGSDGGRSWGGNEREGRGVTRFQAQERVEDDAGTGCPPGVGRRGREPGGGRMPGWRLERGRTREPGRWKLIAWDNCMAVLPVVRERPGEEWGDLDVALGDSDEARRFGKGPARLTEMSESASSASFYSFHGWGKRERERGE